MDQRAIEEIIDRGAITPWHQPIVRLADGSTAGWEALARVGPSAELPEPWLRTAAELGLRTELELACLRAIVAAGAPPDGGLLFVNLSLTTLADDRAPEICSPLADRIVVEVAEHERVRRYEDLEPVLARWRATGVRLATDRTGAGYASFRHVLEMGPHFLKLDRSIVSGLDEHDSRRALVNALAGFAELISCTLVAEGVERWEDVEVLRDAGVDLAQGFAFGGAGPGWPPAAWPAEDEADELVRRMAALHSVEEAATAVCEELASDEALMPSLYLERDGFLRCQAQRGYWQVLDGVPVGSGVMGRCMATGAVQRVDDVAADEAFIAAVPDLVAQVAVPLRRGGRVVGVLNVESPEPIGLDVEERTIEAAGSMSAWLDRRWSPAEETPLIRLARFSKQLSGLEREEDVERVVPRLACLVSGLSTAVLVRPGPDGPLDVRTSEGPLARAFQSLDEADLARLLSQASKVASFTTSAEASGRMQPVTEQLRSGGAMSFAVVPLRTRDGAAGFVAVADARLVAFSTGDNEAMELLVSEAARSLDLVATVSELTHLATHDPLTGLGNHRAFHDHLAALDGTQGWALVLVDLDRFKSVNDGHGHIAGDEVLRELAGAFTGAVSEPAHLYRQGGDEFAVLLENADEATAADAAGRLVGAAEQVLARYGAGASVGAAAPQPGESAREVFDRADRYLYDAKDTRG